MEEEVEDEGFEDVSWEAEEHDNLDSIDFTENPRVTKSVKNLEVFNDAASISSNFSGVSLDNNLYRRIL